ncbi:hypothetical protein N5C96_04655 [Delftia tsuruhatensis]|uniref:hypothetical protein n=1 Tax=Delftia tsuruhatensis TaxID=180282 RepID=UPI002443C736|nr:hypothetical protein [Delftia tsuruhatensis]MDH0772683.1 hypothetical protein [Delftia tsuruhatensis]MDH1456840.1 hypothetical protein [Delftia tsuruhatensis]MDH1821633.1 hypothetical protein [Delftia tsuruhatensis]WGG08861.1 hypothetical protein N5O86_19640 [Delftia tsuruhatensis]
MNDFPMMTSGALRAALLCTLMAGGLAATTTGARAQGVGHRLGSSNHVIEEPLQELVKRRRPKGQIYVSIPQALVILANDGMNRRSVCSPQIQVNNSSNQTMEELVAGIRYRKQGNDKSAGSTIARFYVLKVGKQDLTHLSNAIDVGNCDNLTGELEVIECTYSNGADCSADVRALAYGAIPLKIIDKK